MIELQPAVLWVCKLKAERSSCQAAEFRILGAGAVVLKAAKSGSYCNCWKGSAVWRCLDFAESRLEAIAVFMDEAAREPRVEESEELSKKIQQ